MLASWTSGTSPSRSVGLCLVLGGPQRNLFPPGDPQVVSRSQSERRHLFPPGTVGRLTPLSRHHLRSESTPVTTYTNGHLCYSLKQKKEREKLKLSASSLNAGSSKVKKMAVTRKRRRIFLSTLSDHKPKSLNTTDICVFLLVEHIDAI